MSHSYNLVIAPTEKQEKLQSYILEKAYPTFHPNMLGLRAQPNMREVRFSAIDIPKNFLNEFLLCLTPYGLIGNGIKSFLRNFFAMFSGFGNLEQVPRMPNKPIPDWRCHIIVHVFGMKTMGENKRIYMVMESQRKYLDEFELYLLTRKFEKSGEAASPRINEIRLYDISNFESTMGALHADLSPFFSVQDLLGNWRGKLYRIFLRLVGFSYAERTYPKGIDNLKQEWRDGIEIYHLGVKSDEWCYNQDGIKMEEQV